MPDRVRSFLLLGLAVLAAACGSGGVPADVAIPPTRASAPEVGTSAPSPTSTSAPTTSTTTTTTSTTTTVPEIVYVDGAPGSCLILEEKYCLSGEGFVLGGEIEAVGFRIPEGTPLFFPWEKGTFAFVWGGISSDGPLFSAVILFDEKSHFELTLVGFQSSDSLEGLAEDEKTLGIGESEGDILEQGMEVGSVSGESLEGYGDGSYTLVVVVDDLQTDIMALDYYEQLFGVIRFSN